MRHQAAVLGLLSPVLWLLASGLWPPASARAAEGGGGDAFVAPLSKVVGRLAGQDTRAAADWAELGRTTLTYGQRLQSAQQPVPEGPVRDALSAVDAGSALDGKAADWPKLRDDLEALLKKSEEQKQNPPPQSQKQPDKNQSQQQKQDQQKQPDQQNQPQDNQQKQQEKGDANDQKQNDSSQQKQPPEGKQGQSAFGDMKDQPPNPEQPPPGESQKVGGAPEKKPGEDKDLDPALALPLQKLDQLRNQDSPARLFQIMEGEKKPEAPKNGKNW